METKDQIAHTPQPSPVNICTPEMEKAAYEFFAYHHTAISPNESSLQYVSCVTPEEVYLWILYPASSVTRSFAVPSDMLMHKTRTEQHEWIRERKKEKLALRLGLQWLGDFYR